MEDNLRYYIWLTTKLDFDFTKIYRLLEYFGSPTAIFEAGRIGSADFPFITKADVAALEDKDLVSAERVVEACRKRKIEIISVDDDRYPARLRQSYGCPAVIYLKGDIGIFDAPLTVGMVGTRNATRYGEEVAERLAKDLASMGAVIVSGNAVGIDITSVKGALKASGRVISVVASSLLSYSPAATAKVMEYVEQRGTVVSEYPPGFDRYKNNHLDRNRIIAGLSDGVVIVEAAKRSGALNTAKWALEFDRDVFAVPGNITSAQCEGTNSLIKAGSMPILSALDIIEQYGGILLDSAGRALAAEGEGVGKLSVYPPPSDAGDLKVASSTPAGYGEGRDTYTDMGESSTCLSEQDPPSPPQPQTARDMDPDEYGEWEEDTISEDDPSVGTADLELTKVEKTVLNCLTRDPVHIDEICARSGQPASDVGAALTTLELKGYIRQDPGQLYRL